MLPVLIAIGVGTLLVVAFWDEIVNFFKDFIPKVKDALEGLWNKAKVYAQKVKDSVISVIHKLYYEEDDKWYEQTTTREVDESEVPAWAKAGRRKKDITKKMEEELQLEIG